MRYYDFVKNTYTAKRPMSVSWDITNKCNLSCKHCFNNSGDSDYHNFDDEFSKEKALDIAQQLVEMKVPQCCICGGETTLCSYLTEIIKTLTTGGVKTNMVSNGLLIDDLLAQKLKASGINNVQISVDGLAYQHDMFRNRSGAFYKAIDAIKNLRKQNIDTLVSFCPNKYNYSSFDVYLEYITQFGCSSVRMMPLLPLGRGGVNFDELCLSEKEQFLFVQNVIKAKTKYPDVNIEWGDPLEHIVLVAVNRRRNPAVMGILSNGDVSVTPYLNITVDNVYNDSLNNIWEKGYKKVWQKKEILEIVQQIQTIPDLCELSDKEFRFEL